MCEDRAKAVKKLLEQAMAASKAGSPRSAFETLIVAIGYQQDQIRDLERQAEQAAEYQQEQNEL
jgi:hypothetical protein